MGTGFLYYTFFGRKFIIDSVLDTGKYYIPIQTLK
jgi:hypothetical protein